jgi:hypothetical protein
MNYFFLPYINLRILLVLPREINYSVKLQICRFKGSPSCNIILKEKYCISATRESRFLGLLSTTKLSSVFWNAHGDPTKEV